MRTPISLLHYQTLVLVGILSPETEAGAIHLFMKLFLSLSCTWWAGLDTPRSVNMTAERRGGEDGTCMCGAQRHDVVCWDVRRCPWKVRDKRDASSFCLGGASQKVLNQVNSMGKS